MGIYKPKQRSEIYGVITAQVLANAPITSTALGEVSDNLCYGVSDQIYGLYVEMNNALELLKLDTTTGIDLDRITTEYLDMPPRQQSTFGTVVLSITDPTVIKIANQVGNAADAAVPGNSYVILADATNFPATGSVLLGARDTTIYEIFPYDSKTGNTLSSTTNFLTYSHVPASPAVLSTGGTRIYSQYYTASTIATTYSPSLSYTTTDPLIIYDGESTGQVNSRAEIIGTEGNTGANTIIQWNSVPPFDSATVINLLPAMNGTDRETDANLRARIRREKQSLSTANIDAVTNALFNTTRDGVTVKFVQITENSNPTTPSLAYIDDGSGFIPVSVDMPPYIIIAGAYGGERNFILPAEYRPIVATDADNIAFVFPNIEITSTDIGGTSTIMVQGPGPGEYQVNPDTGVLHLNTAVNAGDSLTISKAKVWTGLVQEANWNLYGKREDRENYPGKAALGTWIQVVVPRISYIRIEGDVELDGTRDLNSVVREIQTTLVDYVNGLGIGQTVIRNKIISLAFVTGVRNFILSIPGSDIIVGDGELARATTADIVVS